VLVAFVLTLALYACTSLDPIAPDSVNWGTADFSRYLAFGNSLTAGTQSNGLVERFQRVSYPADVAVAAQAPVFEMPLISEDGIPPLLVFIQLVPTPVPSALPNTGTPTNLDYAGIYNNLGIPGAKVGDLLNTRADDPVSNPFFSIVLRDTMLGATATDQAVNSQPTFTTAWMGANDILGSAASGTDAGLTPVPSFESDFRTIIDRLNTASAGLVVGNIPSILALPFFTTIPPFLFDPVTREPITDPTGNLFPLIGIVQGVPAPLPPDALVTLNAAPLLAQGVGIPPPFGSGTPLPDNVILDHVETANVLERLGDFNTIIDSVCTNRSIPVVDLFTRLEQVRVDGFEFRNETFTVDYVTGGIFSVDGVHPSSVGYYIVAESFIGVINANFGSALPAPPFPEGPLVSLVAPDALRMFTPLQYALALQPGALDGLLQSLGAMPFDSAEPVSR